MAIKGLMWLSKCALHSFIPNPIAEMEFYPFIRAKIEFHPFIRKERYPLTLVNER